MLDIEQVIVLAFLIDLPPHHTHTHIDLCGNTAAFVKSVATLGNVEENDTVSRALARLSEVEEKVETLHSDQVLYYARHIHTVNFLVFPATY